MKLKLAKGKLVSTRKWVMEKDIMKRRAVVGDGEGDCYSEKRVGSMEVEEREGIA